MLFGLMMGLRCWMVRVEYGKWRLVWMGVIRFMRVVVRDFILVYV